MRDQRGEGRDGGESRKKWMKRKQNVGVPSRRADIARPIMDAKHHPPLKSLELRSPPTCRFARFIAKGLKKKR